MSQLNFLSKNVFFTTKQYAECAGVARASASRMLKKMREEKSIELVTRGVWAQTAHPFFTPYGAIPYLLGNEFGYLSFLSVLHRCGVVSQIPNSIQIATTGHSRILKSAIGVFEFFQIQPSLMQEGIELHSGKLKYNIATCEKAMIDSCYLSSRKGRRFAKLPELDLEVMNQKKIKSLLTSLSPAQKKLVFPVLVRLRAL